MMLESAVIAGSQHLGYAKDRCAGQLATRSVIKQTDLASRFPFLLLSVLLAPLAMAFLLGR
jgi:hypothetical protein